MPDDVFGELPSDVVGEQIKKLRRRRGLTAEQLAARCAECGASDITPAVIANIETGRRDKSGQRRRFVTIDELLIFAYVLDVAPVHLFVPTDEDGPFYQVTPGLGIPLPEARAWIRGEEQAPGQDPRLYFAEVPLSEHDRQSQSPADIAAESARIQYHRQHGHKLRSGEVDGVAYFKGASAAALAAWNAAKGDDDASR